MLKHKIIALLAILTLAVSVAACGDDDDDNGNNQTNNSDPNNQNNNNDTENNNTGNNNAGNNNAGNNNAGNNGDDTTDLDIESMVTQEVDYFNDYFEYRCECHYDEMDFPSSDDCEAAIILDNPEALGSCAQGVADDLGEMPASAEAFLECTGDQIADAQACHDYIDFSGTTCTDDNDAYVDACNELTIGLGVDQVDCSELLDDAGTDFIEGETVEDMGFFDTIQFECANIADGGGM